MSSKPFAQKTYLDQFHARNDKVQRRETNMQENTSELMSRRNLESREHFVKAQQQQAPDATIRLDGTERLTQVNARSAVHGSSCFSADEIGNGSAYDENPVSCTNPCSGGVNGKRVDNKNTALPQEGKLPAPARWESINVNTMSKADKRETNIRVLQEAQARSNATLLKQSPLPTEQKTQPNLSIHAITAEKESYLQKHKEGNEEAYGHVEELNKSMRGYDNKAEKKTLDQLKAYNAREQSRGGAICSSCHYA